jgi:hypothetical protein
MTKTNIRLDRHLWGLGVSLITLLIGGWLMLAPFALGYQHYGASWVNQTENDFWLGLGIVIVSVAGIALFVASLMSALRTIGVIRPRPRLTAPAPAASAPPPARFGATPAAPVGVMPGAVSDARPQPDDLDRVMATLAAALAANLAERRQGENGQTQAFQQAKGSEA